MQYLLEHFAVAVCAITGVLRDFEAPQPHIRLISIGVILLLRLAAIQWKLALL